MPSTYLLVSPSVGAFGGGEKIINCPGGTNRRKEGRDEAREKNHFNSGIGHQAFNGMEMDGMG